MKYFNGFVVGNVESILHSILYRVQGTQRAAPLTHMQRVEDPFVLAPGIYCRDNGLIGFQETVSLYLGDDVVGLVTEMTRKSAKKNPMFAGAKYLRMVDQRKPSRSIPVKDVVVLIPEGHFYTVSIGIDTWIVNIYTPGDLHDGL